jgi:MoaA/NifB/PqqE/SkfB family radical SAM enzyme
MLKRSSVIQAVELMLTHPGVALRMGLRRLNHWVKFDYRFMGGRSFRPETAILCPTMQCNFNCAMCYSRKIPIGSPEAKRELTTEEWKKLIDELAGFVEVIAFGGGEPLLRADIFELIGYAKVRGRICNIVTNGALLKEAEASRIVESGVDFLSISLDDFHLRNTPEKEIRDSPIVAAIGRVMEARRRLGRTKPHLNVSCVVWPGQIETPRKVLELFREMQWDKLSFFPVHFYPASLDKKQAEFKAHHVHTGDYMFGMRIPDSMRFDSKDVDDMLAFFDEAKRVPGVSVLRDGDPAFYHRYFSLEPFATAYCSVLYDSLYVDGFGNFSACQTYILGNVRNERVAAMWNGEKAVAFRRLHKQTSHPMCYRCS